MIDLWALFSVLGKPSFSGIDSDGVMVSHARLTSFWGALSKLFNLNGGVRHGLMESKTAVKTPSSRVPT